MKIYRTATREDYDSLMTELEGKGCEWLSGHKPTQSDNFRIHGKDTYFYVKCGGISLSDGDYFNKLYKDEPIIEYKSKGENNMKIYHTATRKDYDALMIELESKGFKWPNGEKPTEQFNYNEYMSGTTITTYADSGVIRYSCVKDDMEISPDEPIIEYKAKGESMLNTECKQCKKKWHNRKAKYCSMCGEALVAEPEFKVGDIVASKIFADGSFSFIQLKEDLTNHLTSVDGLWYIRRDCTVYDGCLGVFKKDTRHATPEEILEYKLALNFHEHGREPFELKEGDLIRTPSEKITFIWNPENYTKEDFLGYGWEFLKTAKEVSEWLKGENE